MSDQQYEAHQKSESIMSITLPSVSPATTNSIYSVAGNKQASVSAPVTAPDITPRHELDIQKHVIYGSSTVSSPAGNLTLQEREQRIDAYAGRVVTHTKHIESGTEGQSNVNFQKVRQFLEPGGYFSGGLLAGGYDPHEKFEVTFQTWTGVGKPDVLTGTDKRSYFAWEIAAGALAHDKVLRGGPVNFQSMHIDQQDRGKVGDLEAVGQTLQKHWENEIAEPMRDASGKLAQRSGRADAYVVRGTLQSLTQDKSSFGKLSPEGQEAANRTLHKNGEVIIPNLYGYPLAGYAFIPYTPYDGKFENRPNKGLMIDLKNGAVSEIQGDKDFANWAKNNRSHLLKSFNASDMQGGKDAHWPKAWDILDNLISGTNAHYPGYSSFLKDKEVPVAETFNYTEARKSEYQLKYGNLNTIASKYQDVNTKNAIWSDQTEVFGSSQQNWKAAKDLWGNTFGYLPVAGNVGNIVFGIHDAIYGKTADDRVGGGAAAVISGLQLAHELAPFGAEAGLENPAIAQGASAPRPYSWKYNEGARDFDLVHTPKTTTPSELPGQNPPATVEEPVAGPSNGKPVVKEPIVPAPPKSTALIPTSQYAVPGAEQLLEGVTPDALGVYRINGSDGVFRHFIRCTDETDTTSVFEIESHYKLGGTSAQVIDPTTRRPMMRVRPNPQGDWERAPIDGGLKWPWESSPAPAPASETVPASVEPQFADYFVNRDGSKIKGSEIFDKYMNLDETTKYKTYAKHYEEGTTLRRELNLNWRAKENDFSVLPGERATANENSVTPYSPNFLLDLNRDKYTITIKGSPDVIKLDAMASSGEEIRQLRVNQFEAAIPDAALRSRISEIAQQASLAPMSNEMFKHLKTIDISPKSEGAHYNIVYDPATNQTEVHITSNFKFRDVLENGTTIDNISATMTRKFRIAESNELIEDGNPYVIEKKAPTMISVSTTTDPDPELM